MAQAEGSGQGTGAVSNEQGGNGYLIFPVIGTIFFLLVLGFYVSPELYLSMGMGLSYAWWSNMAMIVLLIMLILTGLVHMMRMSPEATEAVTSPPETSASRVEEETVIKPEEEPVASGEPRVVEYPQKITGAIYGDVLIKVDPLVKLKLRTLLARSCLLCDHQEKCYKEYGEYVDEDDFLANTECKRYLNKKKQEA